MSRVYGYHFPKTFNPAETVNSTYFVYDVIMSTLQLRGSTCSYMEKTTRKRTSGDGGHRTQSSRISIGTRVLVCFG